MAETSGLPPETMHLIKTSEHDFGEVHYGLDDNVYRIVNNKDGTFTLTGPDGIARTGKFCTAHTREQHDLMMDAGVYC